MAPKEIMWVRYTWDLSQIAAELLLPPGHRLRLVVSSYASDTAWKDHLSKIESRLSRRIAATLGHRDAEYLVVEYGGSIAGVSGVADSHPTNQNLLTGPCVMPEHQRKGLGTYLLGASLSSLRRMGLAQAVVYSLAGCMADKHVYPKFGSTREETAAPAYLESG